MQRQANQYDEYSSLLDHRDNEIAQIEQDSKEINEIFQHLSLVVVTQGSQLDTIESAMDRVDTHVEAGLDHIKKGQKYQTRSRRTMCWILLLAILTVAIILVVVLVTRT